MVLRPENLPRDPDRLIEMVLACEGKIEALQATITTLKTMIFGARSEKSAVIIAEQLSLGLGDAETDAALPPPANDDHKTKAAPGSRNKRNRNIGALPKHLPRCDVTIEPETTACPCCTGALHRIGEDVSEVLDKVPAILRVLRFIRPKYACRACEGTVVQAKARPRLIESGMASTALVAWIAAAKFAWGSTLYRQAQILAGHGLNIDRQTLARWMKQAAWMAKGVYELQLAAMHEHPRLFCDETPMPVLDPGRGRTRTCQFWAHATDDRSWRGPAPPAVAYVFAGGRGKKEILTQLTGFEGVLQVDGYAAYASLAGDKKTSGKIRLAFCLVHARRNFVKVHKTTNSPFAKEVIERIAAVYAIEERIRGFDADQRRAVRQAETKPLMDTLKARLEATTDGWSRTRTLSSVRSGRYRSGRRIACSVATKAAERPGQSSHRFSTPANSTESIPRPIWPTFSNAWCRARRRTTSCMNCSSGTGNPRARLRRPRHDSEKEAQGGKGDQPGQDDGRLRHVVRPAWSLDGGTRQIDFPSPSPGDFPFDARRRRGLRRGGASLDESRRVGLSSPRPWPGRLSSLHGRVLRDCSNAHPAQRDQQHAFHET